MCVCVCVYLPIYINIYMYIKICKYIVFAEIFMFDRCILQQY